MAQHIKPQQEKPAPKPMRAFSFGAPETVLAENIGQYMGVCASHDGRLYTPPVSRKGLAKLLKANAHHGAIPGFKRNLLLREFIASPGLSVNTMSRAALDFMVFGEAYFYRVPNILGQILELQHLAERVSVAPKVRLSEHHEIQTGTAHRLNRTTR